MTELLRRADVAMYVAKQSRRGTATEKTSLIDPLTTVVLGKALAAVHQWRDAGRYFGVLVNVSPHSLANPQLLHTVDRLLRAQPRGRWLCLLERPLTIATAVSMVER